MNAQSSSNKYNIGSGQQGTLLPCNSLLTGPCSDRAGSGNFLFAECSACYGSYFNIYTPYIAYSSAGAKLTFWYYIYGAAMNDAGALGNFNVLFSEDNGTTWTNVLNLQQEQQTAATDPWVKQVIQMDGHLSRVGTSDDPIVVQYLFQAITGGKRNNGDWWQGDYAFDDVVFTQTNASNATTPYVPPILPNSSTPTPPPSVAPPPVTVEGGDGLSTGAIVGIVVGVVGGLCCLLLLLLLLVLLILLIVSPRKPPSKGGEGM